MNKTSHLGCQDVKIPHLPCQMLITLLPLQLGLTPQSVLYLQPVMSHQPVLLPQPVLSLQPVLTLHLVLSQQLVLSLEPVQPHPQQDFHQVQILMQMKLKEIKINLYMSINLRI